jgi:polysaccharide deacetylase family protein (PEP-CTERM system associated)
LSSGGVGAGVGRAVRNILTVDIEDYFHPTEVAAYVDATQWETRPSRVERATRRTLELLAGRQARATMFVLGWVAERFPRLVREMDAAGHEIGCHSYAHRLVYEMTPEEFRRDTERAVEAIGAACGKRPRAYRAPSYSIVRESLWALEILVECGFTHDSSIYPIHHDRYGIPGFGRHAQRLETGAGAILEAPVATVQLRGGRVAPVGGGAYLRLLPYRYTAAGVRRINREERQPACLYFHPWELDAGQPRLVGNLLSRWRAYGGLKGMEGKLDRLVREFSLWPLGVVHP